MLIIHKWTLQAFILPGLRGGYYIYTIIVHPLKDIFSLFHEWEKSHLIKSNEILLTIMRYVSGTCAFSLKLGLKIILIYHFSLQNLTIYLLQGDHKENCGSINSPFNQLYEIFGKKMEEYPHISPQSDLGVQRSTLYLHHLLVLPRVQRSIFPMDSIYSVEPPRVSQQSKDIYATYTRRGQRGAEQPAKRSMQIYHRYIISKYM